MTLEQFDKSDHNRWAWRFDVYACPHCAKQGLASFYGLNPSAWNAFARNMLMLRCEVCDYEAQLWTTKQGRPDRLQWLPLNLTRTHAAVAGKPIKRLPGFEIDDRGVLDLLDGDPPIGRRI